VIIGIRNASKILPVNFGKQFEFWGGMDMDGQNNWRTGKLVLLIDKDRQLCLMNCQPVQAVVGNPSHKTRSKRGKKIYASSKIETTL